MQTSRSGSVSGCKVKLLEQQLSYWREQLAGAPPVLELPTTTTSGRTVIPRSDPLVSGFGGGDAGLKALSRSEGATLFMTLLAAFKVVLSRYSGQTETSLSGLRLPVETASELEPLIGFFVNTLVLRTEVRRPPNSLNFSN